MAFTPIETLAFIIAALTLVKLLTILVSPMSWLRGVVKPVYSNSFWTQAIGLILAGVALFYLLQELTIIQIFAVMFLWAALMLAGIGPFNKELLAFATKLYKQKGMVKRAWLSILIWLILVVWVLAELF